MCDPLKTSAANNELFQPMAVLLIIHNLRLQPKFMRLVLKKVPLRWSKLFKSKNNRPTWLKKHNNLFLLQSQDPLQLQMHESCQNLATFVHAITSTWIPFSFDWSLSFPKHSPAVAAKPHPIALKNALLNTRVSNVWNCKLMPTNLINISLSLVFQKLHRMQSTVKNSNYLGLTIATLTYAFSFLHPRQLLVQPSMFILQNYGKLIHDRYIFQTVGLPLIVLLFQELWRSVVVGDWQS